MTLLTEDVGPFSDAVAARDEEAEGTTGQGESPAEADERAGETKVSKTDRPKDCGAVEIFSELR